MLFSVVSSFRSWAPSGWVGLESEIIFLMLEETLACLTLTFDQNNSPNKELDATWLNIFPEDRTRENKQAHFEGFWLGIWKHFDTTKITKHRMDCWEGLKSLFLWRSLKQGQIVYLICLGWFKIRAEWRLMVQAAPWRPPLSQALSESRTLYITHQFLICWVWRTPFYPRMEKGTLFHNCEFWVKL